MLITQHHTCGNYTKLQCKGQQCPKLKVRKVNLQPHIQHQLVTQTRLTINTKAQIHVYIQQLIPLGNHYQRNIEYSFNTTLVMNMLLTRYIIKISNTQFGSNKR